jgi:hypothetical protein
MKRLAYLLSAVLLGAITIIIAFSENKSAANSQIIVGTVQQESPNMVDGSKNPELIPDRIAYALLLRLIANRRTEQDKGARRLVARLWLSERSTRAEKPRPSIIPTMAPSPVLRVATSCVLTKKKSLVTLRIEEHRRTREKRMLK